MEVSFKASDFLVVCLQLLTRNIIVINRGITELLLNAYIYWNILISFRCFFEPTTCSVRHFYTIYTLHILIVIGCYTQPNSVFNNAPEKSYSDCFFFAP